MSSKANKIEKRQQTSKTKKEKLTHTHTLTKNDKLKYYIKINKTLHSKKEDIKTTHKHSHKHATTKKNKNVKQTANTTLK